MAKKPKKDETNESEEHPLGRPTWSGAISFGLISIPIQLYTGTRDKDVRFNMLHETDNSRVEQKIFCATEKVEISRRDTVKGYQIASGQYVVVTPDELASLTPKASRLIELISFVDLKDIDPMYFERPYYVLPAEHGAKPYQLLVKALEDTGKGMFGRFVMRSKEYLVLIRPQESVLCLETLYHADELVKASTVAARAPEFSVTDAEVKMARQLITSLSDEFHPEQLRDAYRESLLELIDKKAKGKKIVLQPVDEEDETPEVVDLMAALRESIEKVKKQRRVA